jgi:D-sedoheptulose 7-phosphate isomerase
MSYSKIHIDETIEITKRIDVQIIEEMVDLLAEVKKSGGRIFVLGVGGSAANASHAVNDFRKLAGIETYAPTDNVAEITARTNDEGWETVFSGWLKVSNLNAKDCLLILSVGGGNKEKNVSPNLIEAIDLAKIIGSKVIGIVGRDGGYTAENADVCLVIPTVNTSTVTPHSESFQAVVWHLMVSHPKLKANPTKW